MVLGHSTQGRPVIAFRLGDPASETKILVVGCIHGNECAGTAIARALIATPPADIDLWVIRNLNPDGFRAGTRQNGRGVDLNRNFPYQWRPIGRPWDKEYSGTHPLSEPEDRIARRLIARVHPDVTSGSTNRSRSSFGRRATSRSSGDSRGASDSRWSGSRDAIRAASAVGSPLASGGRGVRRRTARRGPAIDGGRPVVHAIVNATD